jgi:hypothetical protein
MYVYIYTNAVHLITNYKEIVSLNCRNHSIGLLCTVCNVAFNCYVLLTALNCCIIADALQTVHSGLTAYKLCM